MTNLDGMSRDILEIKTDHTTLRDEVVALRDSRSNRTNTPPNNRNRDHVVVESDVGYEDHYEADDEETQSWKELLRNHGRWHGMTGRQGRQILEYRDSRPHRHGGHGRFEGHGHSRYYDEEEYEPRYDDPTKNIKHTMLEFHAKFDPDSYLEWESQVEKIFSLHNYSKGGRIR